MKVLVITRNAWDETNAIGNTLSNFLCGIENAEFANICFRSSPPNNTLCSEYYQMSEFEVMKKWFAPHKIGRRFSVSSTKEKEKTSNEKKLVRIIHKYGVNFAYKISDYLWDRKKWINNKLDEFIRDFSPDIAVTFVKSNPQYYLTVKLLREKYGVPVFSWIADDEYSGFEKSKSEKQINRLRYVIDQSSVVTGCSREICEYYNRVFGCRSFPLYKSCDFSAQLKNKTGCPLTIVYAGNLLYGRLEIIKSVAQVVKIIRTKNKDVVFEIYSNTELTKSEAESFFKGLDGTRYIGKRDYGFIKKRLSDADMVLLAESFDEEQILKTKYSFSTKIVDYLQCGSVILAIGPSELSSIKYIREIPGTVVIDDLRTLDTELVSVLEESENFPEREKMTREFAKEHHNPETGSRKLTEIFRKIIL